MKAYRVNQYDTEVLVRGLNAEKDLFQGMHFNNDVDDPITTKEFDTLEGAKKYLDTCKPWMSMMSSAERYILVTEYELEEVKYNEDGEEVMWELVDSADGFDEIKKDFIENNL